MDKFFAYLGGCLVALPFFVLVFLIANGIIAAIFMWIWNTYFITTFASFGLPALSYWPAFWISFMIRMLFTNTTSVSNNKS